MYDYIEYRNGKLFSTKTQSFLKFIKTVRIKTMFESMYVTRYYYRDLISDQRYDFSIQELEQIKNLSDNNLQIM